MNNYYEYLKEIEEPSTVEYVGKVKNYCLFKKCGWIFDSDFKDGIRFFNPKQIDFEVNDTVSYKLKTNNKGIISACNVKFIENKITKNPSNYQDKEFKGLLLNNGNEYYVEDKIKQVTLRVHFLKQNYKKKLTNLKSMYVGKIISYKFIFKGKHPKNYFALVNL